MLLWASAFIGIRSAGRSFGPGELALFRLAVGTAVLGVLMAIRRERLPRGRDLLLVGTAGVAWFAVYNLALNAGERRVDAGTAAMLVNVGPLLIVLFAGLILREGFPRALSIGLLVAFAGAVVVGWASSRGGATSLAGVGLCLLAAVTSAAGVIAQKPALVRVSALSATFTGCAIGLLVCLPFTGGLLDTLHTAPAGAVWTVVYLGVFPTAIAFTTWAFALRFTTAGRLGVTTYVVPALVLVLGAMLLHETPPAGAIVGGGLCLAGVAMSRIRGRRPGPGGEPPAEMAPEVTSSAGPAPPEVASGSGPGPPEVSGRRLPVSRPGTRADPPG